MRQWTQKREQRDKNHHRKGKRVKSRNLQREKRRTSQITLSQRNTLYEVTKKLKMQRNYWLNTRQPTRNLKNHNLKMKVSQSLVVLWMN